jgi:hypothetical protein
VLIGKDFRRCHDACLVAIIDGNKAAYKCHECLTATDIALQQSVHLSSAAHIVVYLSYHSFLRSCEREWQVAEIESIEIVPYAAHYKSCTPLLALVALSQQHEFEIE